MNPEIGRLRWTRILTVSSLLWMMGLGSAPPLRSEPVGTASEAGRVTAGSEAESEAGKAGDSGDTGDSGEEPVDERRVATEAPSRRGPPPPLGVLRAEPLEEDRFRISYTFERRKRQGLLVGDRDRTPEQIRNESFLDIDRTPRSLEVSVHTVRVAYAPHPRITLLAELPIVQRELERFDMSRMRFQNQTEGVGDVGFAVLVPFIRKGLETSHVHLGVYAPTGSIRRKDGEPERLPYDAQPGNGTWDLEWGWTYRGAWRFISWGAQAKGRHPVGRNDLDYREGSRFNASMWGATELFSGLSASLRFGWEKQNNIAGRDRGLDPIEGPSENPKARGGTRFDLSPGLTLDLPRLANQRLSVELDLPVYQELDGPQLERDWAVRTGWQWVF